MATNNKKFAGQVAVITASSTGIGLAMAERLASEGCTVVISSRNQEHIDKAVKGIISNGGKAIGIPCHVGSKQDRSRLISETVRQLGGIDYLVCNAAVSTQMGNFLEATDTQIQKMWDINFKSAFFLIQEALPHLRKRKGSNILILASYAAFDLPSIIGHYAITKTALVALTKILARQLSPEEIRVNCIAPGLIKTKFSGSLWKGREQESAENMGVTRLGEVEDIANAARFLLSDEASYITGETLLVAGKPNTRL